MKKVILITGVAGMIGSNLLKEYINKNFLIIGIDNLTLGDKKFISQYLKKKNFFFFKYNLENKINENKITNILEKNYLQEAWLLAANSDIKNGTKNPNIDLNNTFLATFNTLNLIRKFLKNDTKILFSSSSAIYGDVKSKMIVENTINKPISNYGAMKLASEAYLSAYSKANGSNVLIFRFPNVIGHNLTHGLLFDMKKKILSSKKYIEVLGNGNQQKPYSHVSEIIRCMIYLKKKRYSDKINYFNIGTNDKGIRVKEIVKLLKNKFKSKKKIIYQKNKIGWIGDIPRYQYSTKKLKKTGFQFKLSSRDAINKTVKNI